jgi:hypothetical protein
MTRLTVLFRQAFDSTATRSFRAVVISAIVTIATSVQAAPLPQDSPIVIQLHPAGEPVPALKYRLVPERSKQVRGNAAIFYHRASQMLIMERGRRMAMALRDSGGKQTPYKDQIGIWTTLPISEIPREEARELLNSRFGDFLYEVEQGAIRDTCDWEFDKRTDGIWLRIPEMDEIRNMARAVVVKARLAILDGNPDEAIHWIEIGRSLGRHAAQGPLLIQALVGVSINTIMNNCILELIQAPGTPSLYWAFADRPRPFIDPQLSYDGERFIIERELPELKNLEDHVWSDDEAHHFADALQRKLDTFSSEQSPTDPTAKEDLQSFERRFRIAAMASRLYPEASRALISKGWPEEKVKAMPIIQVACLHTYLEYKELRDDIYKWLNVPFRVSYDKLGSAMDKMMTGNPENQLLTMFGQLTPSLSSGRMGFFRLERQLDAIQAIEAIRLYAHNHQGKLPPTLDAITEAPVPLDPATGMPFEYVLSGDSATLATPIVKGIPNYSYFKINYLLKLSR